MQLNGAEYRIRAWSCSAAIVCDRKDPFRGKVCSQISPNMHPLATCYRVLTRERTRMCFMNFFCCAKWRIYPQPERRTRSIWQPYSCNTCAIELCTLSFAAFRFCKRWRWLPAVAAACETNDCYCKLWAKDLLHHSHKTCTNIEDCKSRQSVTQNTPAPSDTQNPNMRIRCGAWHSGKCIVSNKSIKIEPLLMKYALHKFNSRDSF